VNTPQYVHDCKKCHYLSGHTFYNHHYDLYVCVDLTNPRMTSLIARESDEDSNYTSSPVGIYAERPDGGKPWTPLAVAYQQAIERGLALPKEALDRNDASLHLSEDMMQACKLVEAAQAVTATFIMTERQIQIAKRHIECFLIRGEEYEKEYWTAVVKYLTAAQADALSK